MEPLSQERDKNPDEQKIAKPGTQEWHTNLYDIGEFGSGNLGFLFDGVSSEPMTKVDITSAYKM